MYTSGRHDYRGVKVEKEEGRQRGILPNLSGPTSSQTTKTTVPDQPTVQHHYCNYIVIDFWSDLQTISLPRNFAILIFTEISTLALLHTNPY